jgi:hypothetical protein
VGWVFCFRACALTDPVHGTRWTEEESGELSILSGLFLVGAFELLGTRNIVITPQDGLDRLKKTLRTEQNRGTIAAEKVEYINWKCRNYNENSSKELGFIMEEGGLYSP